MIAARATDFASWRTRARALLSSGVRPEDVVWSDGVQGSLFAEPATPTDEGARSPDAALHVPARFVEKAEIACDHADPERFAVLYRLLWKATHGVPRVLDDPLDPDRACLETLLRQVRDEEHDMHAFVRFRRTVAADDTEHWIAWYRPSHPVLARVAPFFARRYPNMRWTLFTPERSAHWDRHTIAYGPGAPRESAPPADELDALFLTYYESVFNPARTNVPLMQQHLPSRVRAQIPEGAMMHRLARESTSRVGAMNTKRASASEALLPIARDIDSLSGAACACRACPIGERATQTVFGQGPRNAQLMIVGEQPGDEEDRVGRAFVGPAGRQLDDLMARAGLARESVYVTNAVKHFKWEPRGKRRIHSRPNREEVDACRGWLLAEVAAIEPKMILCLGATAAQSFCGPGFRVGRDRGKVMKTPWAPWWMATYHPSALLRAVDEPSRLAMERDLLADLIRAREQLAAPV